MTDQQLNMAAHQHAQLLIERLRDPNCDTRTTIANHVQQLRLLIEPVNRNHPSVPYMRVVKEEKTA